MKKLLFLFLAFPLSISALSEKDINIECNNLKIGSNANCVVKINNDGSEITGISFDYDESLLNLKSDYELKKDTNYQIKLDSTDEVIKAFSFDFLMEYNNIDVAVSNLKIDYNDESENFATITKTLQIKNAAFVDNIYINNQPIIDFDKNVYTYKVNLYERNDYVEIKIATNENNTLTSSNKRLIKFVNGTTINFEVKNDSDVEIYKVTLIYDKQGIKTKEIKIKEIPFNFNSTKRYYYLEVAKDVSKLTFDNGLGSKQYDLNTGKNRIVYNNNGLNYIFDIKRLKTNQANGLNYPLKSVKIGDTFLSLQADSYNYTYQTDKVELIEVETEEYQDYDIKYNDEKIVINLYDAKANKKVYNINLIDDNSDIVIEEYSKTNSIIVAVALFIIFTLLGLFAIKTYRPFSKK